MYQYQQRINVQSQRALGNMACATDPKIPGVKILIYRKISVNQIKFTALMHIP